MTIETVGAFLCRPGEVLLGLRASHKSYAGCWDIFGGHVEEGEEFEAALQRELHEELGIYVTDFRTLGPVRFSSSIGVTDVHCFAVDTWTGEPSIQNDEHSAIRWFTINETLKLPDLALEEYKLLLRRLA